MPWPDGTFVEREISGGGVALFDYDNDGRLDILQVCHARPGHFDELARCRLFHQEADGSFREVPDAGGINTVGYGQGVAIGDYDNDGFPDIYVTNYGHNVLYHNNGNGSFTDVTAKSGLATSEAFWSTSAAWVDVNRDGRLDLLVARFTRSDEGRVCQDAAGKPAYCAQTVFPGAGCVLYHNNGDGTFTDVTEKAGLDYPGRAWGVVCADLSGGGGPDLYVANDGERQNLWVNQHNGTFRDEALERGIALNGAGRADAGMGIAAGDIFNDGRLSVLVTHISDETNILYEPVDSHAGTPREDGDYTYADQTISAGMASIDIAYTGWGCGFFDFHNDGNLDLAVVNGRVGRGLLSAKAIESRLGGFWRPYAQANTLYRGDGRGRFTAADGGDFTARAENTRGLAFGDIDNDGRVDLVTNGLDNTLHVYRNVVPRGGNHWLSVRAMTGKRDALGARLDLFAGAHHWTRLVWAGYSFCSSSDPRAHFGLGGIGTMDHLDVTWPDGRQERFPVPRVDCQIVVAQGQGQGLTPAVRARQAAPPR